MKLVTETPDLRVPINDGEAVVILHHPLSNESYFATQSLQTNKDMSSKNKISSIGAYAAACIKGWENDDFFGGPYTPERAQYICSLTANSEFALLVVDEMTNSKEVKSGTTV